MRTAVIEQRCKSLLNRVSVPSFPFRWSINPYRGCEHACVYCYARRYHEYLELDPGRGFETRIIAKVNAPQVLERELARRTWQREWVAIGTAVDPYQPAEGRYRLTRRILELLLAFRTPCSIVTKNTMILRDLDILRALAAGPGCEVCFSVTTLDRALAQQIEPDTPPPRRRLEVMGRLAEAKIPAGVLIAPVLPGITDAPSAIRAVAAAAVERGAHFLRWGILRLEGATREVFFDFLSRSHPELRPAYQRAYERSAAPEAYRRRIEQLLHEIRQEAGIPDRPQPGSGPSGPGDRPRQQPLFPPPG
ncbi:MAG TPA: radical SAM protein [Limnochordia bacterium]